MTEDMIIKKLWRLLDNIDTYSDLVKGDYELFYKLVYKEQQKRWELPVRLNEKDEIIIDTSTKKYKNITEAIKGELPRIQKYADEHGIKLTDLHYQEYLFRCGKILLELQVGWGGDTQNTQYQ